MSVEKIEVDVRIIQDLLFYLKTCKKNFIREGYDGSVEYTEKRIKDLERLLKQNNIDPL